MTGKLCKHLISLILFLGLITQSTHALAGASQLEFAKKTASDQIHHLLEPILDKYCHDSCKLLGVHITIEPGGRAQDILPGFDEGLDDSNTLTPSQAAVKLLIDDKLGPVSRDKLLELIQQFLDTLDYPVKIESQIAHFPAPQGSESRIAELKDRVSREFQNKAEGLLRELCSNLCMLTDYDLQAEAVNGEEAQYGASEEFITSGDAAIKIKEISATILMDDSISALEQNNILEMLRLKTNSYKHVSLTGKSLKFPRPALSGSSNGLTNNSYGNSGSIGRSISSEENSQKNTTQNDIKSDQSNTTENSKSELKNESNSSDTRVEKFQRIEKIERVENGDKVIDELGKLKYPAILFVCSVLSLLIFIAFSTLKQSPNNSIQRILETHAESSRPRGDGGERSQRSNAESMPPSNDSSHSIPKRYEIERLIDELSAIYAGQPRVAKQVFSRILTEEGGRSDG
ncbi:unnamed protein product [Sphagnum tenellum]